MNSYDANAELNIISAWDVLIDSYKSNCDGNEEIAWIGKIETLAYVARRACLAGQVNKAPACKAVLQELRANMLKLISSPMLSLRRKVALLLLANAPSLYRIKILSVG